MPYICILFDYSQAYKCYCKFNSFQIFDAVYGYGEPFADQTSVFLNFAGECVVEVGEANQVVSI